LMVEVSEKSRRVRCERVVFLVIAVDSDFTARMRKGKRRRRRASERRKERRLYTRESGMGWWGWTRSAHDGQMGRQTTLPLLRGHVGRKRRLLLEAWATRSSVSQLVPTSIGRVGQGHAAKLTASPHEGHPFAGRVARSWRGFTHQAAPVFARSGRAAPVIPRQTSPPLYTLPDLSPPICMRAAVIIVLPLHLPRQW